MSGFLSDVMNHVNQIAQEQFSFQPPTNAASVAPEAGLDETWEYASTDYAYGYTAPSGGVPTHISDGELLLWLENKSNDAYARVRDVMELSTQRSKLMQDLTHVKGLIEGDAPAAELEQAITELQAAYAGTPYEGEIAALIDTTVIPGELTAGPVNIPLDGMTDDQEKALVEDYQAAIDKLGRDDQLALVQIQDLMSNIREMSQLTSNLLASRDQASNTIVGNIRG